MCLTTLLSPVDPVDPVDQPVDPMDQPRIRTDLHTYRYVKESFTWTLDDDWMTFDQASASDGLRWPPVAPLMSCWKNLKRQLEWLKMVEA